MRRAAIVRLGCIVFFCTSVRYNVSVRKKRDRGVLHGATGLRKKNIEQILFKIIIKRYENEHEK